MGLEQFRTMMVENGIPEPVSAVTDRELALMAALDELFPSTTHLLCKWHVNMNVLAKCEKWFPGPVRDERGDLQRHPQFKAFIQDWNTLLLSTTEFQYNELLKKMESEHPRLAMSYVSTTWLIFKEKLVKFWVDQHLHFGYLVTSR